MPEIILAVVLMDFIIILANSFPQFSRIILHWIYIAKHNH